MSPIEISNAGRSGKNMLILRRGGFRRIRRVANSCFSFCLRRADTFETGRGSARHGREARKPYEDAFGILKTGDVAMSNVRIIAVALLIIVLAFAYYPARASEGPQELQAVDGCGAALPAYFLNPD